MSSITVAQPNQSNLDKPLAEMSYEIVHQTKGRIRLRVPQIAQDCVYANRLEQLILSHPGVTKVALKPEARSLTVCYQSNGVSGRTIEAQIAIALQRAHLSELPPQKTSELAKRLGVAPQALTWHRSQIDFADWSQVRDPEAIAWQYDAASKTFSMAAYGLTSTAQPTSSKGQQILQALGGATTSRVGGIVGKLAGEVIGLLLLGSAGLLVGAEVGTFVGEIVGSELGSFS